MLVLILNYFSVWIVYTFILIDLLKNSPYACEDENGFHLVRKQ
jgi:hypothetical protein